MNLYERDFSIVNSEVEQDALSTCEEWLNRKGIKNTSEDPRRSHPDCNIREFLWHKTSLFPNNHLMLLPDDKIDYVKEAEAFRMIIQESSNEQELQSYIKNNRKWFIPGSIFLDYNFGHHDAYLFPEQSLGGKYSVDYLMIGFNSDGCNLVLVEFEKANTEFIISTYNSESASVRKGLSQIRDWRAWMDDYRMFFLKEIGITKKNYDVPSNRIYYYLVVSKREKMNEEAKTLRSQLVTDDAHLKIVTFDRLADNVEKLAGRVTW